MFLFKCTPWFSTAHLQGIRWTRAVPKISSPPQSTGNIPLTLFVKQQQAGWRCYTHTTYRLLCSIAVRHIWAYLTIGLHGVCTCTCTWETSRAAVPNWWPASWRHLTKQHCMSKITLSFTQGSGVARLFGSSGVARLSEAKGGQLNWNPFS
jgi:hypothetical protein